MARLGFLAVCAYLTASTVNLWVGHRISKSLSADVAAKPKVKPLALGPTREKRDFASAANRNMFGSKREAISLLELNDVESSGNWEDAVPTTLGARLIATAVFIFPQYSLASIEAGGNVQSYSVNECPTDSAPMDPLFIDILGPSVAAPLAPCNRLLDAATIKRIEEDRVIIFNENARRYEYLALHDGFVPVAPSRKIFAPPTSSDNLGSTLRKVGQNKFEIEAKDFDATMGNLSQLATQARIVPAFEDGKSVGFKLFNIAPGSLYAKVGLQDGDIITKINGYELNSPDKALELYQMRSTASQLNIDYKRGGTSTSTEIAIQGRPR